jgi:outer membrane protein assembly factor BamB
MQIHTCQLILLGYAASLLGCSAGLHQAPARSPSPGANAKADRRTKPQGGTVASVDLCQHDTPALAPLQAAVAAFEQQRYSVAVQLASRAWMAQPQSRSAAALWHASRAALRTSRDLSKAELARTPAKALQPLALSRPVDRLQGELSLRQLSKRQNLITDTQAWLDRHELQPPAWHQAVAQLPDQLHGGRSRGEFSHGDHHVGYFDSGFVAVVAPGKKTLLYDARPALTSGPVSMQVMYGQLVGKLLVLQLSYNGYAKRSGGRNGYLAAFGRDDGKLRWITPPLRGNLANFLLLGDAVLSGYGFTAEPDYLYLTDLKTGRQLQQIKLHGAPSLILRKERRVYVRTYDHDYVFELDGTVVAVPAAKLEPSTNGPRAAERNRGCLIRAGLSAVEAKNRVVAEQLSSARLSDPVNRSVQRELRRQSERAHRGQQGGIDLATVAPVVLKRPPWKRQALRAAEPPKGNPPKLELLGHQRANPVRNLDPAHAASSARLAFIAPIKDGALPEGARPDIPTHYASLSLRAIIPSGQRLLLIYGGRYLAVLRADARTEQVFDLEAYRHPPYANPRWVASSIQDLTHAQVVDGVAYVCNGGGSYAKEVRGKKGFVSAIDLATGALLWRSKPLVCNSTIALYGDYLLSGYGFTAEPDFLYLMRRADGKVLQRTRLRTGPDRIEINADVVSVETYGDSYRYKLTR